MGPALEGSTRLIDSSSVGTSQRSRPASRGIGCSVPQIDPPHGAIYRERSRQRGGVSGWGPSATRMTSSIKNAIESVAFRRHMKWTVPVAGGQNVAYITKRYLIAARSVAGVDARGQRLRMPEKLRVRRARPGGSMNSAGSAPRVAVRPACAPLASSANRELRGRYARSLGAPPPRLIDEGADMPVDAAARSSLVEAGRRGRRTQRPCPNAAPRSPDTSR